MKVKEKNILTQRNGGEKVLYAIIAGIFALYALVLLFPFVWLIVQSFGNPKTYSYDAFEIGKATFFYVPKIWHFENYVMAFQMLSTSDGITFFDMLLNSLWYVGIGVVFSAFWHSLTGYVFAKYEFKGKAFIYSCAIFSMTIPLVGSSAALYRLAVNLRIYDTGPLFLAITCCGGFGGSFLMMYGIFKGLSWTYVEAVYIDGGGDWTAYFKIILPQAMPAIFAIMVNEGIALWNNYTQVLLYMPSTPTLASGLYQLKTNHIQLPLYYAGLVISMIPVVILYAFMSGSMMKNLSIGGIKG